VNNSEQRPPKWEWFGVIVLIAGLMIFNLATYNYFPTVWCDEVAYSEPAINKILYGSYTTTVWEFNPINTFPIVNCPLYGMALVPWLTAVGTSLVAVRSFNYMLMGLAAFLCWTISWRFGLVKSSLARLLMVGMLHFGYGMGFAYRSCRPDVLGLVCLLSLVFVFGIRRHSLQQFCIAAFSAITIWIGLQIALFAVFAFVVSWIVFRRVGWRELICLAIGMATGAGSLILFLYWKGVLAYFLPPVIGVVDKSYSVAPSVSHLALAINLLKRMLIEYKEDFSIVVVIPLLVLLAAGKWLKPATRKFVSCGLIFIFGTPVLFEIFGHFALYYSGLRFVPAILALSAAYSELSTARVPDFPRWLQGAFAASMIGAALVGLPLRLGITLGFCKLVPREEIRRIIRTQISSRDIVFTEYVTFFEVKQIARTVYDPFTSMTLQPAFVRGYDLSEEERRSVSVMVIRPEQKERLAEYFGGKWEPASAPFGDNQNFSALMRLPIVGKKFASHARQPQIERFPVQIFRRMSDRSPIANGG
jgi:hypothetical protein